MKGQALRLIQTCLLVALASCTAPTARTTFEPDSMPTRWIRAIEQQDWQAMGEMLAENAFYDDTTIRPYDTHAIHVVGPQAIMEHWSQLSVTADISGLHYTLLDRFEIGAVTVLHMNLDVQDDGASWGVKKDEITLSARVTTVLTIVAGKIVHVHDHVDDSDLTRQIAELRAAHNR